MTAFDGKQLPSASGNAPAQNEGRAPVMCYTYVVLPGNESVLMQEALQRRPWWGPATDAAVQTQAADCTTATQPATRQLENRSSIRSSKHHPIIKAEVNTGSGAQFVQFACHSRICRGKSGSMHSTGSCSTSCTWDMWYGCNGQVFDFGQLATGHKLASSKRTRIANRLPCHSEICTKSGLAAMLARLQASRKQGPLPWVPFTMVLPGGKQDTSAYTRFSRCFKEQQELGKGRTWIVKPTNLNRGNQIEVFNDLSAIQQHLQSKKQGSKWVVQKYIEQPALIHGRKFDIRAYVLVTPDLRAYMHQEAYVRTSSVPYKQDDLTDRCSHLTNDAVQKHLDTYHTFEDHCKMDLDTLQVALGPDFDIQGAVVPAMHECARQLFGIALPRLNPHGTQLCWELLGLDFMIDSKGQVYLIEVNTSPALFRAGTYLADLLPRVVEDCVQKAIDPHFSPPSDKQLPTPLHGFQQLHCQEPLKTPTRTQAPVPHSSLKATGGTAVGANLDACNSVSLDSLQLKSRSCTKKTAQSSLLGKKTTGEARRKGATQLAGLSLHAVAFPPQAACLPHG